LNIETSIASLQDNASNAGSSVDLYRPRRAWFHDLVEVGPISLKINAIAADGRDISVETFAKAKRQILSVKDKMLQTPHQNAGFAILHEGEDGRWLLLHWWLEGGILGRKLWRADLGPDAAFMDADPLLFACVWELGLIEFERRAWMETAMSGKAVSGYIGNRFSGDTV
jgi:hypothetical protein